MDSNFEIPVLFVIFNRPDITYQVFDQIKKIKPKYLFIAADGPRNNIETDIDQCKKTRAIIESINWPCELKLLFRNENLGCGLAVCSAISWFFENVEQGIILEDDCFPDLSFFPFCGELLTKYKDDQNIYLISGTNFQNGILRGNGSYYFSNYPITWGWASWRRAWQHFNHEASDFTQSFSSGAIDHAFQSKTEKKFWKNLIRIANNKKHNIWDHQWFYAIWKNKGISITPNVNLIINLGFRKDAVHNALHDSKREPAKVKSIQFPLIHPIRKIETSADHFVYKNVFSHSIARIYRLIKENGVFITLNYAIKRILND